MMNIIFTWCVLKKKTQSGLSISILMGYLATTIVQGMIYCTVHSLNTDIMRMAQINQNWNNINTNCQWRMQTMIWREATYSLIAFNTTDIQHHSSFQPGDM